MSLSRLRRVYVFPMKTFPGYHLPYDDHEKKLSDAISGIINEYYNSIEDPTKIPHKFADSLIYHPCMAWIVVPGGMSNDYGDYDDPAVQNLVRTFRRAYTSDELDNRLLDELCKKIVELGAKIENLFKHESLVFRVLLAITVVLSDQIRRIQEDLDLSEKKLPRWFANALGNLVRLSWHAGVQIPTLDSRMAWYDPYAEGF